ncbi:stemmadenine O-acetyltransferase-like [Cornus florida]|uniref:stemmadenine O-acetyltransferase-like n=1 Tax=Cornus florida TaxID=4283 RepID=UPI0028A0968D|nr:stemmadenine O-acetyltransferase-like [Cornus florida]
MMKVEITSTETIKPSSPTPQTLQNFKLSLLDQLSPSLYVPLIFFYAPNKDCEVKIMDRINVLKKSLSETLTRFYPVAGRTKDNLLIECNDEGVDFLEAKVNCPLFEVLKQPEADVLNHFLPQDYHFSTTHMKVQLATQVNIFSCGGMAIGVCMSHKIFDGNTIGQFINGWGAMSCGLGETVSPIFQGASLFPPRDLSGLSCKLNIPFCKCITKRFVFDASNIALLRAKVTKYSCVDHPTRFEVTSALIWKCAMEVQRAQSKSFWPCVAAQIVNLRPRMVPPIPEQCAGNLWWAIVVAPTTESEIELHDLVCQIRNEKRKFDGNYVMKMQGEEGSLLVFESFEKRCELSQYKDFYRFTSLHHFPLYEADFGWGKPVWISSAGGNFKNFIVLMDTPQRKGIEAWVTLDEKDMPFFECDHELLTYISSQS